MANREHFLALDWLRGAAAIVVLFYHRRWTVPGGEWMHFEHGWIAVDFFFMLSGVVVAYAYGDMLREEGGFGRFLLVRAIRLHPLLVLGGVLGALSVSLDGLTGAEVLSSVFVGLGLPSPASLVAEPFFINGPVWSLFFELLANLALAIVAPWLSGRRLALITALAGGLWLWMLTTTGFGVGFKFGALAWGGVRALFPFLVGIGLYRLRAAGWAPPWKPGLVALTLPLLAVFAIPGFKGESVFDGLVIIVLFPALIVGGMNAQVTGRQAKLAALTGALSYPIYVLHFPLYRLADALLDHLMLRNTLEVVTAGLPICGVAWLVFRFYDEPVRRLLMRSAKGAGLL
jgi:peptidoglycan/LPS O-acetylase OafA/YrhL